MPILVKGDDVRSGTKLKARRGGHGSQWVKRKFTKEYENQL